MTTASLPIIVADIPGLTCPLTKSSLTAAPYREFDARPNNNQPDLVHVEALGEICKYYGAEKVFGIQLVHRHGAIPSGTVMIGFKALNGIWTKPTKLDDVDLTKFRGNMFCVSNGALIPYELREGAPTIANNVNPGFFTAITDYIKTHCLENSFGLQVCSEGFGGVEYELHDGSMRVTTLKLPRSEAIYSKTIQTIGWHFGQSPIETEEHAETIQGQHKVSVNFLLNNTKDLQKLVVEHGLRVPQSRGLFTFQI